MISQAIYAGYCHSFPDSYRQFGEQFKEDTITLVYDWITGGYQYKIINDFKITVFFVIFCFTFHNTNMTSVKGNRMSIEKLSLYHGRSIKDIFIVLIQ